MTLVLVGQLCLSGDSSGFGAGAATDPLDWILARVRRNGLGGVAQRGVVNQCVGLDTYRHHFKVLSRYMILYRSVNNVGPQCS